MKKNLLFLVTLCIFAFSANGNAQTTIPGDSLVFGPMFSPVYNNSVRVWMLTKNNTGTGDELSLSLTGTNAPTTELTGNVYNSDDRLGYSLRSYEFTNLTPGETYTAKLLKNEMPTERVSSITNEAEELTDFEFLSGGCARIYDLSRCIDQPESEFHFNGDPEIFNVMANEPSKLMIWLGDATYLLGLQHAMGQCPDGIDDWANKDMAFDRYMFYRAFHDNLLQAMPQLAITDNHDLGPNEFNKNMPTINETREIFMDWWPNPEYKSTPAGQGLFSSYNYKDVEFFLLDNRSYRDDTTHHLGPDQFEWLKDALLNSTANFKVLINGTPSFERNCGGRNFCNTDQSAELIHFIKENNINGVLSLSADIHEQRFMIREGDVKYPLYDVLSGNLNSDVGNGNYTINYGGDYILTGVKQTYLRVNVFGEAKDRRLKVDYVGLNGEAYFSEIIHQDMLTSVNEDAYQLGLPFHHNVEDISTYQHEIETENLTYGNNRHEEANEALRFMEETSVEIPAANELSFYSRAFSLTFWVKPDAFSNNEATILSNATENSGVSFAITSEGKLKFKDYASQTSYLSNFTIQPNVWSYITWKYDNVRRKLSLYYNGFLIQSWANVISPEQSMANLSLGNNFEGKQFFGLLDEVNLYGRLIPDEQITEEAEIDASRGQVLKLNGGQQLYIPSEEINPVLTGDFTIEFWGKLNADPGTNFKIMASNGRVDGNSTGISFEYPDSNKLNVVVGNNGSGWNTLTEQGEAWNIGEWNHIALTFTQNNTMKYYVNGTLVGEAPVGSYVPNDYGFGFGYSPYYGSAINGELDEVSIWNRVLSEDEIASHLHYPLQGNENGLAFYYSFDSSNENQSITSQGTNTYEMQLDGGSLSVGTSPVAAIDEAYQAKVTGQWSKSNGVTNAGWNSSDEITSYISNVVIGKNNNMATEAVSGYGDLHYVTGGWQVKPLNMALTTITIDLPTVLADYENINNTLPNYYLIKETGTNEFMVIAQGTQTDDEVSFSNFNVTDDVYYLAWGDASLAVGSVTDYQLDLFPNPTQGKVTLSLKKATNETVHVEVYDLLGRKLIQLKPVIGSNNQIEIDLSNAFQNSQLLIVKVTVGTKTTQTFKVLKSK